MARHREMTSHVASASFAKSRKCSAGAPQVKSSSGHASCGHLHAAEPSGAAAAADDDDDNDDDDDGRSAQQSVMVNRI
jgi:hypothetical protein